MIRLERIAKRFRRHQVLQSIDLTIERGHRVALVGSNGAGKTTLIRCLLGEYTCEGKLTLDGLEPRVHRREVLAKVGFVPQLPPPLKMPVGQLIRFAAKVCGSEAATMLGVARRLGFDAEHFRHQPFVKLSGGQKQKLLISIALGRATELLIMDEPAANLDPEARHIFFELLAEKRDSAAMIISSHRLDEVATLVNRVVEMDQGRIVLDDQVEDLVELTSQLHCMVNLLRADAAFAKAIGQWRFVTHDEGLTWMGYVAGPDRLRFLGLLSRYAGILAGLRMDEAQRPPAAEVTHG